MDDFLEKSHGDAALATAARYGRGCNTDARAHMTGLKGHARIERAPDSVKQQFGVFGSEGPVIDQIAAGLRAKFDPRGILNSGLMG